jgi:hypothetical protein
METPCTRTHPLLCAELSTQPGGTPRAGRRRCASAGSTGTASRAADRPDGVFHLLNGLLRVVAR